MKNIFPLCTLLVLLVACAPKKPSIDFDKLEEPAKRLAENAVYGMEVAEGCDVQLFASEPMLINPTNLHVDERGRVWVCEALNYRNTHNPENPSREKGDRILILEDTDGDAKADKSTVFYQGTDVNAALGIWATDNHAIVSCSPYVFLLSDTNGDDKADTKDTLFTGLGGEQSDHAIHSFIQGPDGKLYFNFGNNGQQIMDRHGKPVIDMSGNTVNNKGTPYRQGMVFRCDPDGSNLEVLAHNFRNNYEVAPDSYGTLWQSDNDDDGNMGVRINYVMEYGNYGYTDQVTGAWWGERRINLEPEIPKRHWHLNDPGVVPNLLQTGSGSPCGMAVYEGEMLPKIFWNQPLHAEAGHNVVRAYPAQVDGAGYKAEVVNLVKSKDQWFRPSDVCVAPDGSVFISDWYDPAVGGHKFGDTGRGRIFRVSAGKKGKKYLPAAAVAGFETADQLLESLQNPNLAVQAKAANALRSKGSSAEAGLKKLWTDENPRVRARALWILGKMKGKAQTYVQAALKDKDADIRTVGLRLARQVLPNQLAQLVKSVVSDPSAQVRREAAIALRFAKGPEADQAWAELASQYDGKDRWYLEALGIGSDLEADTRLAAWKAKVGAKWNNEAGKNIVWRSRSKDALPLLKEMIQDPQVRPFDLRQYFRALHFQTDPLRNGLIASLVNADHPLKDSINLLALFEIDPAYFQQSAELKSLADQVLPSLEGKVEYLDLLERLQLKNQNPNLLNMALQSKDEALRGQAASLLVANGGMALLLQQLKGADDAKAQQILYALAPVNNLGLFKVYQQYLSDANNNSLALRRAALNCLNSTWDGQIYLLDLFEKNQVPEELAMQGLVSLSGAWNTDVRKKSREMLTKKQKETGNALPAVAVLEGRSGKVASGKAVFLQHCANCHKVGNNGVNFGPALTEIGAKLDKGALYNAIIFPSSGINYGYEGFNVALKDGSTLQGIIESKTASQLTLRIMGGTSRSYPLSDVQKMEEMPLSLMTEGLHRGFTEQQLVDLVEYLATLKPKESI
ncbi:PVC-type heme-binding CxxCH protein [Haliscomenobacter hydrossis]|nr:PVC-type heme-binding CxxCH protein [Haliscomenobacter hydrossis]